MHKTPKFTVAVLIISIFCTTPHAAPLKYLSLDFERELIENEKTEQLAGTLHFDANAARVVVEVMKPLKQIMIVENNILEIYYPVERQAFRIMSKGRVPLPFVESIIQSAQAEHSLTAIGYSLDKHEIQDDMLYTYWIPPDNAKDKIGAVVLGMRDDRILSTEVKNPKGDTIARSQYQDHSKLGISFIPMTVTSKTYGSQSEVLQHERIFYSNPQVNAETPNPILNFTIPESVQVKVVKW